MKKYIYGALFLAAIAACWIFFMNPSRTANEPSPAVLAITFQLPEGYAFTEGAPFSLAWQTEGLAGKLSAAVSAKHFNPLVSPYKLQLAPDTGARAVVLKARLYYCHKTSRMCFQKDYQARLILGRGALPKAWLWKIEPLQK